MMGKRELIDIAGEIRGETEKAYRIFDGMMADPRVCPSLGMAYGVAAAA